MKTRLPVPRATYRLQFHRGFTLRHALALLPYLDALGVSHVYASPLLKARPGSTARLRRVRSDPAQSRAGHRRGLGGVGGRVARTGHGAGAGHRAQPHGHWRPRESLVVGRAPARPVEPICQLLRHRLGSARSAPLRGKVLVPVLGDEFERVLARGELQVVCENAEVTVRYFDQRFPVSPDSILVPGRFLHEAMAEFNSNTEALASVPEPAALPVGLLASRRCPTELPPLLHHHAPRRIAGGTAAGLRRHPQPHPRLAPARPAGRLARRSSGRLARPPGLPAPTGVCRPRRLDRRREDSRTGRRPADRLAGRRHHRLRLPQPCRRTVRRPCRRNAADEFLRGVHRRTDGLRRSGPGPKTSGSWAIIWSRK